MGVLDDESHQHRSPEWSITGKDSGDDVRSDVPGPGTYSAPGEKNAMQAGVWSLTYR